MFGDLDNQFVQGEGECECSRLWDVGGLILGEGGIGLVCERSRTALGVDFAYMGSRS